MISNRLKLIASFVPVDSNVADIGSDHGYLLIYLKDNFFSGKLLGVENKKGPFNSLKSNISNKKYDKSIAISFSDGLDDVDLIYDTVVLAGMGADNIQKILSKNFEKLHGIKTIIVDSHTKNDQLRIFLVKLGYKIDKEDILFEDNIYYEIMRFVKGNSDYNYLDFYFGPLLRKNKSSTFISKYNQELKKYIDIIDKIENDSNKKRTIQKKIDLIRKIL